MPRTSSRGAPWFLCQNHDSLWKGDGTGKPRGPLKEPHDFILHFAPKLCDRPWLSFAEEVALSVMVPMLEGQPQQLGPQFLIIVRHTLNNPLWRSPFVRAVQLKTSRHDQHCLCLAPFQQTDILVYLDEGGS